MQKTGIVLFFLFVSAAVLQETDTYNQCVIIQERESIVVPFEIPPFLKNGDKTYCQAYEPAQGMLRCGESYTYIKPECVCSFYNVYEATFYHSYSSCPESTKSDMVTQLKCPDCKKYSLNNTGPCINGGKLTCRGEEVAPEITCQCPPNYEGKFCEIKIENVTRICDMVSKYSTVGLPNCTMTGRDCITYSRNRQYAYKCNETHLSQDRKGLPLCVDTENTTPRHLDHTHQDFESLQKEVILANSGGKTMYNLSKLAVILVVILLHL
ncbi:coagulation factor XII-like [Crassostrea virginica]